MNKIIEFFFDSAREQIGIPARLQRLLETRPDLCMHPDMPRAHIGLSSVVQWQEWTESSHQYPHRNAGWAVCWKQTGDQYRASEVTLTSLSRLTRRYVDKEWPLDIREVDGFAASKSNLHEFESMDAMVEANSHELIADISTAGLHKMLAHKEIRVIHGVRGDDYFLRHSWDDRVFLMNSGGSHHFAAAKYIASRLDEPVQLTAPLHTIALHAGAVYELCAEYELFAISDEADLSVAFNDAMRMYGAHYLWRDMPRPWQSARAILLPRRSKRSMKVAAALRNAGAFDIGAHLVRLLLGHPSPRD